MQYAKLYEHPTTGAIDHVETSDAPFGGKPNAISVPGVAYIVHEVGLQGHPDGFKRARYLLERMEVAGNAPRFKGTTQAAERMNIETVTRRQI